MLNEVKSQEQHNEKEDKKDKKQSNGEKDSDFKQNVARIKRKNSKELKEIIAQMYPTLFKGFRIMEPEHHITLNVNATPVVHPPRKIPMGLRDQLKKELDSMDDTGVIKKVNEPTE